MVLSKSQIKMYIIFNKENAVYWKYKTSTYFRECLFFIHLFFLCPHLLPSQLFCVEERNKRLWSQRKAWLLIKFWALAVDGQLLPVAFSPEAAVNVGGLEAGSAFHAGPAVKLIARTSQNSGGWGNISKHGGMVAFVYKHGLYKKNTSKCLLLFSTKQFVQVQGRYMELTTRSSVYRSIRVKQCKCLPLLTVASFCLAS